MTNQTALLKPASNRRKFLIGGAVILLAVVYLIASSTVVGAQYFYTVDELQDRGSEAVGQPVRIAGAVLGDSIQYNPETLALTFTIVHMPGDNALIVEDGGLAEALHIAVEDSSRTRLDVEYIGVKPDLLRHEAQAILTGELGEDGVFHANELLLRCPTRYEEAVPGQAEG